MDTGLSNNTLTIVALVAIIVAVVLIITVAIIVGVILHKRNQLERAGKVKVKKGVRYSVEDNIKDKDDETNITFRQKDFALKIGKEYTAVKKGDLMPGKYTILTQAQEEDKINIRLGKFVREYKHGDAIVIPEGETICSVSHSVVLR